MFDFKVIKLVRGAGNPKTGGCWMSALSLYAGEKWSDHPDCVCPVIRELCIRINDALPSDESRARIIGPRLFDPIGTLADYDTTEARRWVLIDAAVRQFAPYALDAAKLPEQAAKLRALPVVTRETAALAAYAAARAANAAARAAYAAARAADAAYAARAAYAAARAADERFVIGVLLPVLDRMLSIGNKTPIEMACQPRDFARAIGAAC